MTKTFQYNEELGQSICLIWHKGNLIMGDAWCHDEDLDMKSERTGGFIAEARANIAHMQHQKNYEIRPALEALKHVQASFKTSKYHNPDSYESKFIEKQIKIKEEELKRIKADIAMEKQYLDDYIKNKDIVYKRIRKARSK